jgi:hypothetical protein
MRTTERFVSKPTEAWTSTVTTLKALAAAEGWDRVDRAFAAATTVSINENLAARLGKAKRSPAHPCIARLISGTCSWSKGREPYEHEPPCEPPVDDHPSLWIRDGKPVAYVSEHYDLDLPHMREIIVFADRWQLDVWFSAYPSPHFPGRTMAVVYTKRHFRSDGTEAVANPPGRTVRGEKGVG